MTEDPQITIPTKWGFSLGLLAGYILTFMAWRIAPTGAQTGIWLVSVVGLVFTHWRAERNRYFANRWDGWFHGLVILDLFLEGMLNAVFRHRLEQQTGSHPEGAPLINFHEGYGFLVCALAFSFFVGGYRAVALKKAGWKTSPRAPIASET